LIASQGIVYLALWWKHASFDDDDKQIEREVYLAYYAGSRCMPMVALVFEPISVNDNASGGACELRTFDDISAFVLTRVQYRFAVLCSKRGGLPNRNRDRAGRRSRAIFPKGHRRVISKKTEPVTGSPPRRVYS
jgi:hypothetical protein